MITRQRGAGIIQQRNAGLALNSEICRSTTKQMLNQRNAGIAIENMD